MMDAFIKTLRSHPALHKNLIWLEAMSDTLLEEAYQKSACLLAASQGEGFGLPLIEAAKYQLPIIARDIPPFREVCAEAAWYFNGERSEDLAASIKKWLDLYAIKAFPQSETIACLSWKDSAAQLLEAVCPV